MDGDYTTQDFYFNIQTVDSSLFLRFDFGSGMVITDYCWLQQNMAAQGVWQWQGSNDASTWDNIGASFTLGMDPFSSPLEFNSTAYRYYQIAGVSGVTSSSPYVYQMLFEIAPPPIEVVPTSYSNGGTGDRTGSTTVTTSTGLSIGDPNDLVNGNLSQTTYFWAVQVLSSAVWLQFDFGVARQITGWRFYQSAGFDQGMWQTQYSDDGTTWTSIGSPVSLTQANMINISPVLGLNTVSARYYRWLGVSGTTSTNPFLPQVEFKISPPPP